MACLDDIPFGIAGSLPEILCWVGYRPVMIDANDSQVDGPVSSITTLDPIADKWVGFGWEAFDVDGHDLEAISAALANAVASGRPSVVIGRTSTVHGVTLPDGVDGHFIKLPEAVADLAITELEDRLA